MLTGGGRSREVRVPKTAELVARELRRQIVRGELNEGDALPPETELMSFFGVSRPTLREAFRVLESEALISVRRGSHGGARVHVPKEEIAARYAGLVLEHRGTTLSDICEVRAILEPPCAARLAETCASGDIAKLEAALEEAEAVAKRDPAAAAAIQTDFHVLVVSLGGNQTLQVLHGMLQHLVDEATRRRIRHEDPAGPQHTGAKAHRRVVELIAAGDAAGAEELWRRHVVETTRYLLAGPGGDTIVGLLDP